ncbi:MAG: lipopolysaccharide biosynthesis protein RfbH [Nitrospira sp.]|nr:lipopolysaccharide biosynthesis protein RfbH [Nitrospira sp.]
MALDAALIVPAPAHAHGANGDVFQGGLKTGRLTQLLGTEPLTLPESLSRFRRRWRADTIITYAARPLSDEADKLKKEILEKVQHYYAAVHRPKPFVPYKTRIQYAGRVFGAEEMVNLVDSALDFWLTLGPYGERFEQHMKRFFGARDFLLVNSGSTANLLAVMTLCSSQLKRPLRPGDEVITTPVGFPTTLAPIVHGGLIPMFVDAEVGTYNINPHLIEAAVSDKTRAIVIAHTLGNPCDMEIIADIARRYELYLVEDCCDALGGTFRDQLVGTFGDLATLSFYPAHQITMGEGGGVVVNRPWLSRIARSVRDWGRDCWCGPGESNTCGKRFGWRLGGLPQGYDHKYIYSNLGYNFKPTDMQAAIGVAQAERVHDFVARRRRNFQRLYDGLAPYQDKLILPTVDPRANPSWFGFPITVKDEGAREPLVHWLENANIETREIFGGNLLHQPAFQHIPARIHGDLRESDRIMRNTFFIGVYPGLTAEMVDFVLDVFRSYFKRGAAGSVQA